MVNWNKLVVQAEKMMLADSQLSLMQVAHTLGANYHRLYNLLKPRLGDRLSVKNNGKTPIYTKAYELSRKIPVTELDHVKRLYFDRKKSLREVGMQYGVTAATVLGFLRRHGFSARSVSEANALTMSKPEVREKLRLYALEGRIGIYRHNRRHKDTAPELLFRDWCEHRKIKYVQQFQIEGYYHAYDFYLPEINTIIEIDGVIWHSKPDRKEKDLQQSLHAVEHGYRIIRITDKEASYDVFDERLLHLLD